VYTGEARNQQDTPTYIRVMVEERVIERGKMIEGERERERDCTLQYIHEEG